VEIEFLDNTKLPLIDNLIELLQTSDEVMIAVAFIKKSGLERIFDFLTKKNTKVVAGLSFGLTDAEALSELLRAGVPCKVYRGELNGLNTAYHPKVYIGKTGDEVRIILGSSNLTLGGMTSNVEANIMIKGNASEPIISEILDYFESIWSNDYAEDLTSTILERYTKELERYTKEASRIPHIPLREPMESTRPETVIFSSELKNEPRIWLCCTSPRNWKICKSNGLWGAKETGAFQGDELRKLKPGDLLLMHVLSPISGEVALLKVTSLPFRGESLIWDPPADGSIYPQRVTIEILCEFTNPVKTSEWLEEMVQEGKQVSAVKGAKKAQQLLQGKAMIPLTRDEFEFIYERIRKKNSELPKLEELI